MGESFEQLMKIYINIIVGGIKWLKQILYKKLYMSLVFSKLVVSKLLIKNHRMHNLFMKFVKFLVFANSFQKILSTSGEMYSTMVNYINGKPIGRIK